jgi:hypothetical protein
VGLWWCLLCFAVDRIKINCGLFLSDQIKIVTVRIEASMCLHLRARSVRSSSMGYELSVGVSVGALVSTVVSVGEELKW